MGYLNKKTVFSAVLVAILTTGVFAQFTHPGCSDLQDSDFRRVDVISQSNDPQILEPLKMDFDMDAQGNVDIYFVERLGNVKRYNAANQQVTTLGNVTPATGNEDGLVGIALHPEFATNRWVFLFYSKDTDFRLSRFTLNAAKSSIQLNTEQIILGIPTGRGRWHTAGGMNFDQYGDLWLAVGDNEASERGPANTADLRGGVIRIHPEDDGSYTIPDGNLWEKGVEHFETSNPTVSAAYADSTKVKRELFVMGTRNAYGSTIEPVRQWVTWGDCGPDFNAISEEHTVATEPMFAGWPYFTSIDYRMGQVAGGYDEPNESFWGNSISMTTPMNQNNTINGVANLLPFTPATYGYQHSCAMAGPIYRYDGALNSSVKLPPHYDGAWFISDFNSRWIKAADLADDGLSINGTPATVFGNMGAHAKTLDFQIGPDGALYYLGYSNGPWRQADAGTGIRRIEYTGTCRPATPIAEYAGCMDNTYVEYDANATHSNPRACINPVSVVSKKDLKQHFTIQNGLINVKGSGEHVMSIMDIKGNKINEVSGKDFISYKVSHLMKKQNTGIYFVQLKNGEHRTVKTLYYNAD